MCQPRILSIVLTVVFLGSCWRLVAASESMPSSASEPAVASEERVTTAAGSISIDSETFDYTTKVGTLFVRKSDGTPDAELFYVAYTLNGADPEQRPVTFIWNGGPGGTTMPMDILGFGPMRYDAATNPEGRAPFRTQPNPHTLLKHSDLVFIDLIGTGYSRAVGAAKNSDFWGVDEDADVTTRAIERYLALNNRWQSPKFILGNSYGTTRASVVANLMQSRGIALNGVILVASALNFGAFSTGMDHQFVVTLPTLAAIAWHHNRTAHQSKPLRQFLDEVAAFSRGPYAEALYEGNALSPEKRKEIGERLAGYIGLDPEYVERAHLRVSAIRFRKELLRQQGLVVGRMDGRETATDFDHAGEEPESDYTLVRNLIVPAASILKDMLGTLNYTDDGEYILVNMEAIKTWNWHHRLPVIAGISKREIEDEVNIFPQNTWVLADLGAAMRANPSLKVLQLHGYFDLATPFAWADYDLARMTFDENLRKNVRTEYYEAGHAIYADNDALAQMARHFEEFYRSATTQ